MSEQLLAGQVEYYRRRASEYDETAYGDLVAARARIARVVGAMRPSGRVLEIACGTGLWTEALARTATAVTALDAAPEAVAIARRRVPPGVRLEVADIFSWTTEERFDVVFFSAWLSHVPARRFAGFWGLLRGLLAEGGRVLFVDEHVAERAKESYVRGDDEIVERRLQDGTSYRIVKNFVDPEDLTARLRGLGWQCRIGVEGSEWVWVVGEARPAPLPW